MQEQLYGLMAVVEDQQKTMQETLVGLAAERDALRHDLAEMRRAMQAVVPALQEAAGAGAAAAMTETLSDASKTALRAFDEATRPVVTGLAGATQAANEAQQELHSAVQWFTWKWVIVLSAAMAAACLVAYASTWWTRNHADRLQAEVYRLQETVATLERKGGRVVTTMCGTRLCIEVDKNQGDGINLGKWSGWSNPATGAMLVIPKGY